MALMNSANEFAFAQANLRIKYGEVQDSEGAKRFMQSLRTL